MEDLLLDTLKPLGYPVSRQGSYGREEQYPESFFTYWNNGSDKDGFFDNKATQIIWNYDLNFYSISPSLTYSMLERAGELLETAGFITTGTGYDVPSDEPTHTGRGMNILIVENI